MTEKKRFLITRRRTVEDYTEVFADSKEEALKDGIEILIESSSTVEMDAPKVENVRGVPSPWAVFCDQHGKMYLTKAEYNKQLTVADDKWICPRCSMTACWDDANYAHHLEEHDDG